MNRRPDAPDPLSPEERALADRLLRLGPHEGPSPALDAAILAAARAAVGQPAAAQETSPQAAALRAAAPMAAAPVAAAAAKAAPPPAAVRAKPNKSRWPAWIGVAASLSLAVGVAWQLRPQDKAPQALSEAQIAEDRAMPAAAPEAPIAASEAADAAVTSMPSGGAAADAAAEAASDQEAKAADAVALPDQAPALAKPAQPRAAPVANAEPARSAPPGQLQLKREVAPMAAPPMPESMPALAVEPVVEPIPAPPPPPAAAAPALRSRAAAQTADSYGYQAPADAAPAEAADRRQRQENAAAAKRAAAPAAAAASQKARADSAPAYAETAAAAGAVAPAPAAPPPPAQNAADTGLDQVQVTGSRIASPQRAAAPPPEQWLERIRQYRDDGQTDLARQDLRAFRRAHPHIRIPKDLRPLLE
ncbi:hypothetical protein ABIE09_001973 [Lysobacter enzymogenes]|uniref:hypothetical protein n=1 Tax=Lysobacter enzymogenes TaxID=69 RepID=UPI0033997487